MLIGCPVPGCHWTGEPDKLREHASRVVADFQGPNPHSEFVVEPAVEVVKAPANEVVEEQPIAYTDGGPSAVSVQGEVDHVSTDN